MIKYIHYLFTSAEITEFDAGMLVILLDALDFVPVIFLSLFVFRDVSGCLLFIFALSCLRQYSGGWHASSIPACVVSYALIYCMYEVLLDKMNISFLMLLSFFGLLYMFLFSPVEVIGKQMDRAARSRNRRCSVVVYLLLLLLAVMLIFVNEIYSTEILLVLIINICLMIILQIQKAIRRVP